MENVQIHIPTESKYMGASLSFLSETMHSVFGSGQIAGQDEIQKQCRALLEAIIHKHEKTSSRGEIQIEIQPDPESFQIAIRNQGAPIFQKDLPSGFEFRNQGRLGQRVIIHSGNFFPAKSLGFASNPVALANEYKSSSTVKIRALRSDEATRLSQLFHRVYGYRYINEYVYFPEKLEKMLGSGQLVSLVAETEDQNLVAHIGLLRWNENPLVMEAALGVVDPNFKGNRLFGQVFQSAIDEMDRRDLSYCVYDFVTNHDFSQRMVAKHGFCDLALFLGNQASSTQARLETLGIGADPEKMDRYSLLVAVGPRTAHPFGKNIVLPSNMGEACEFLLKPLRIQWIPAPRFYPLPPAGEFTSQIQTEQKAVIFDFVAPGRQALQKIIEAWQQHLRDGIQYIAIDVPLDSPGVGQLYDILSNHGFFMAGFIPYHFSQRLGFRFQFLVPTHVNFDAIKLLSENGKKLLAMVRKNYERNSVL